MHPETRVPGAQRVFVPADPKDPDSPPVPAYDKRGRPVWKKVEPTRMATHKYPSRGGKPPTIKEVPIYRGVSAALYNYYRGNAARLQREKVSRYDVRGIPVGGHTIPVTRNMAPIVPLGVLKGD